MNGYSSTGFLSGVLWSCGLHAHWKENIVHVSQCLWESWATVDRQRRHTNVVPFALFLNGEEKYLFSNLDSSLFIVWFNMLFIIKSLFSVFTQYPKQMLTLNNALNVSRVKEKKRIQKIKLMLVSSVNVKCGTIGLTFTLGNWQVGEYLCYPAAEF